MIWTAVVRVGVLEERGEGVVGTGSPDRDATPGVPIRGRVAGSTGKWAERGLAW